MFDCLLSIQHHFYLQRLHFPEFLSCTVLDQTLSIKGMKDRHEKRSVFLGIFGMSHGWTWGQRAFPGFLGVPTGLYRLRCSVRTFPEPRENFSSFPMKLWRTTNFVSSNEVFSDFLQSSAAAFLTFTHATFPTSLQSLIPILTFLFS